MSPHALLRRLDSVPVATAAAFGIAGALLIVFVANYHVPKGENGGVGPGIITGLGCLILATLLFWVLLPRVRNGTRAVVILGALAVISMVAFWSGATPVIAAAAVSVPTSTPAGRSVQLLRLLAAAAAVAAVIATVASSNLG
jgi:hypothetical protein